MSATEEKIKFLDMLLEYFCCDDEKDKLTEIKKSLLRLDQLELLVAEQECICKDCEWSENPGACPDYDESRCQYSGRGEE